MSAGPPQVGWETLPLTVDTIDQLPAQCRACTRWEAAPSAPRIPGAIRTTGAPHMPGPTGRVWARAERLLGRAPGGRGTDPAAAAQAKQAWLAATTHEWGRCGQVARIDGRPVGYVLYAPPEQLPGAATFPSGVPSRGAVVLATAWVDPAARGGGIGRLLVVRAMRDLIERGVTAIEAYGDRQPTPASTCVLPADFLAATGFRVVRRHRRYPRMRLELRTTVAWRAEPERVRERLLVPVAPVPTSLSAPVRRGT